MTSRDGADALEAGFWVVFEGIDGSGKSTQIEQLSTWLTSRYPSREVIVTREPGGTPLGLHLRQAVMHGDHVAPRAEALLYAADRAHHIATVVRPALERGAIVVQDRFMDSSVVYQGGARGLGDAVEHISRWAANGLIPDLTVVLDMPPRGQRLSEEADRIEREMADKTREIREGYLTQAQRDPGRYAVVDARGSIEVVAMRVQAAVVDRLSSAERGSADLTLREALELNVLPETRESSASAFAAARANRRDGRTHVDIVTLGCLVSLAQARVLPEDPHADAIGYLRVCASTALAELVASGAAAEAVRSAVLVSLADDRAAAQFPRAHAIEPTKQSDQAA